MQEFQGKIVLVTGAGRNLGRAIALRFAARGARLALNDINPDSLDATADLVRAGGGEAETYVFDVAKRMPVEAMINQILDDFGQMDILINNAAVHPRARIVDMDEWDWHRTLDVNLGGPFFAMQQAGRAMQTSSGGVIINLGAMESSDLLQSNSSAFLASKAGLIALTRVASLEFAPFNIRVNAVCPDDIRTGPTIDEILPGNAPSPSRAGSFNEVADIVLKLCSIESAQITGHVVNVRGGEGLHLS